MTALIRGAQRTTRDLRKNLLGRANKQFRKKMRSSHERMAPAAPGAKFHFTGDAPKMHGMGKHVARIDAAMARDAHSCANGIALRKANGADFDRFSLAGMITAPQWEALTMVKICSGTTGPALGTLNVQTLRDRRR